MRRVLRCTVAHNLASRRWAKTLIGIGEMKGHVMDDVLQGHDMIDKANHNSHNTKRNCTYQC